MTFYETSRIPSISSPSGFPQDGEDTMPWAFLVVPNWPQRPAVIDKNEMLRSHLLHVPEVIITKVQGQDHLPPEPF